MQKIYNVLLDTKEDVKNPAFVVNTNDLKSVKINLLINQDGDPLDLTGATVRLAVKKPDKTTVLQDITVVDALAGSCEIVLNTQAYVIDGKYDAEVMVYYGVDTVAVTGKFSYKAVKGILDDGTVESTNEWQSINQAIADAEGILIDLRDNGTGVDAQARADIATHTTQISSLASGSPRGTYATVANLQSAFPTGDTNIYLVTADGKWYYWSGSAWTPGGVYQGIGIANGTVTYEKTDFMSRGKNHFDYSKVIKDKYPNNTGALITLAGYSTSDLIYEEAGTYTIKNARWVVVYNSAKQVVNYLDNAGTMLHTVTLAENGYIVVSGYDGNQGKYFLQTCQLEKGSTATAFEQYGNRLIKNLDLLDLTNSINTNKTSISTINMSKKLTVYKSGFIYKIRSKFDNAKDIVIETSQVGSSNNSFNFIQTYLVDKGVEPLTNLEVIHSNVDDITPIRTFTTVGANHGYPNIVRITMVGHDKTTADLGSQWTDGVTTYTLLDIYGNDLVFGCPYTVTNGIVNSTVVNPTANLTHVSGATHTVTVVISALVAGAQLKPSINNISLKFILDDAEITADGTYYGDELQIQESYNVMCYKEIIDYAQSHIGVVYKNDGVGGVVRLSINYVFTEKGSVVIHHNFRALKKVSIGNCGFIQSVPMSLSGYKVERYLPNVLPKSGVDFKTPVDLTTYNQSLVFGTTDYINPSIPPNRHIDWLKNSTTGAKKIAFTMGYVIDKSSAKNSDRIVNTNIGWDLRDTDKSYPVAMSGLTLNAGDYKNFICYRNYLSPNWKSNATNVNIVKDKKDTYVYIDYHINVSFESLKLDDYIGQSITVIEKSADFTIHNDIVDSDGVLFSVANGYGYAVLKLS